MAIIEVLKQGEVDGSDIKYKKNAAKPKIKSADKEVSLNNLNQKATYAFNFGDENKNPEMVHGRLKTERSIAGAILSTLLMVFAIGGGLVGIVFAIFKLFNLKLVLFSEKNYYSLDMFYNELGKFLLTFFVLLLLVSFVFVFLINLSVKVRFRKSYLSKTNVYVYDVFLGMLNVLIFSIIGFVFFQVLNGYYNDFKLWIDQEILDPEVNLGMINAFKYIVVIISALFMSLNSIKGISIAHKMNEFIFKNHL